MSQETSGDLSREGLPRLAAVGLAALVLFRLAFAAAWVEPLYQLQTNELTTTAFIETSILSHDDQNLGCRFYSNLPSVIPVAERALLRATGDHRPFLYLVALLHQLAFLGGVYIFASSFSRSARCGALACLVASFSWVTYGSLGYGYVNYASLLPPGLVFQSVGTLILGIWLSGRRTTAVAAAGIMTNFHPVQGAIILGLLGAMYVFSGPDRSTRRGAAWCALYGVASLPIFAWLARSPHRSEASIDWPLWWRWMEVFKPHHVFPWRNHGQLAAFLASVALSGALAAGLKRSGRLTGENARNGAALLAGGLAALVVTFVAAEVWRQPRVASLMFTRTTVFVVPLGCTLVSMLLASLLESRERSTAALALPVLVLVFVPVQWWTADVRLMLLGCLALVAASLLALRVAWLGAAGTLALLVTRCYDLQVTPLLYAAAGIAFAGAAWKILGLRLGARRWRFLVAATITLLAIVHALAWIDSARWIASSVRLDSFLEAASWIAKNAAPDDQVLVPPLYSKAEIACRRLVLPDSGQVGVSMYDHGAFSLDEQAIRTIYGYDIHDETAAEKIRKLGAMNALVEGYYAIDDARLDAIRAAYPRVRFMLEPAWRAMDISGWPAVHANAGFVVHDVKGPRETAAAHPRRELFALRESNAAAASAATKIHWTDGHLDVEGDTSRYSYQVLFEPVKVSIGSRLEASCEVDVSAGGMIFGVLDKKAERWIDQAPLPPGKRTRPTIKFYASCDEVQLVLTNGLTMEGARSRGSVLAVRLDEVAPGPR